MSGIDLSRSSYQLLQLPVIVGDRGRCFRESTLPEPRPYEKDESHEDYRRKWRTKSFGFRILCDEVRAFLYDLGDLHQDVFRGTDLR